MPDTASSSLPQTLLQGLKDSLGAKGFIEDQTEIAPYVKDWRGNFGGYTPLLLKPASTEEVAEIVKLCAAHNQPITPQGGNTGLVNGGIAHGEITVSMQRMNMIRDIDTHNNSIVTEAGCVLASVHEAAEQSDRYFPLHLGSQGSANIGGLIGTNAGGVSVLRYGMMRDLLLGLEVVTASGEIWSGLSGLRKDNTGYNLKHLFCGAEGTLGIVTAATLKLFPIPKTATAWLTLKSVRDAVELLSLVRSCVGDTVTGFEFMPRNAVEMTAAEIDYARDPLPSDAGWRILLEVSLPNEEQARESLETVLEKALEAELVEDGTIAISVAQTREFWTVRESIPLVKRAFLSSVNHDVSVAVSKIPEFLDVTERAMKEIVPDVEIVAFGHLGDGNVHYSVTQRSDPENAEVRKRAAEISDRVHSIVTQFGGSISAEHGIGLLKVHELPEHKSSVELQLMKSIKQALDPKNIMNPGRILQMN